MTDLLDRLKAALADRYAIEREIGSGGMATVYLAEDLKLHRRVALKVLRPELAAALGPERFLREIEIAAKLHHPHILALHDSGEADGFLYYVMPYVEGQSLRDRLNREGQLPIDDALQITREVADALSHAHSHDVVHRDIKPENILLEGGHAVVTDFGIARAVSVAGGEKLTETGLAVGTPAYMSPEQAMGTGETDARADVYSLACVLYEMLGGDTPFTGTTPQAILARKVAEEAPSLRTLRTTVSVPIEQAVLKALAKAPVDRYTTAMRFAEALEVSRAASARRRLPRRGAVVGLVGVVAVGVLATVVVRGVVLAGDPAADLGHLAVLPCANRLGDPEQEYIPAGVHDEVVTGLGRIAAVEVRGHSSVRRYRDTAMSPAEIAGELGVGGLVECSVYRVSNDSVRVTASLRDALRDRQLWSGTYQRAAADVFLLGSDVALGVAEALQADVTSTESARVEAPPTESREALTQYHRGRYLMDRWTEEGIRKGIEHFEQAIALDSSFALAYAGLAEALMLRGDLVAWSGDIRPVDYMPRARELVLQALDLDRELADGHRMLGLIRNYYDYDYDAGEDEAKLATELDPTSAAAWDHYGLALSLMGRGEEAVGAYRRAIELDPVAPGILSNFSWILVLARKYQETLRTASAAIELDPNMVPAYSNAGDASLLLGNHDNAISWFKQARARSDHPWYLGRLGMAYARVGNRAEALRILDELLEMREQQYVSPRAMATVYLGLDSLDAAIDWLMRGAETRDPGVQWDVWHPLDSDKLRDHPRYPRLLRLMRLER
jgi:serine/threonine-protein kinase